MERMTVCVRYTADGEARESLAPENGDYALSEERTGERTRICIRPKRPIRLISASFRCPYPFERGDQVFLNGYQTWTDTREFDLSESLHNMNLLPKPLVDHYHFDRYGDAWFWKYRRGSLHSFTFSYIKGENGQADFLGSLNEDRAWLVIEYRKRENEIRVHSDCEGSEPDGEFPLFDFVRFKGAPGDCLKRYFSSFGTCGAGKIRGYTSWYLDYQDIDERKIHAALERADRAEFDLFQIDDGYETFVGDWLDIDPVKFPNGLSATVERIHDKGMKAGIWLAPFVCEVKSRLYREHPDWVVRENGRPAFAGCNWSGDVALDIRQEEVWDYLRTCLAYYCDLGFDFFKLDFLYAAAMAFRDSGRTRAELMRGAMERIRGILGDKLILGCGVPLSSAFGLVDYCRIGPDVSLRFDDVPHMRLMHRERISTKNTLMNTIFRSCMDGTVFRCDPDVFLLRDDRISLTREQRKALLFLNHLCGSVYMTSDHTWEYTPEQRSWLDGARKLSEARITGIRKEGHRIAIEFLLDGATRSLTYDGRKGIIES